MGAGGAVGLDTVSPYRCRGSLNTHEEGFCVILGFPMQAWGLPCTVWGVPMQFGSLYGLGGSLCGLAFSVEFWGVHVLFGVPIWLGGGVLCG